MTACHVRGCKGSGGAKRHAYTATHQDALRRATAVLETNGPANERRHAYRDPYGDRRDWTAEARAAYADELQSLVEYGPLPEPPDGFDAAVLITLAEAAERLGMSATTLRHQAQIGRLRARLMGKTYVVSEAEVERYRAESRGQPGRPRKARKS